MVSLKKIGVALGSVGAMVLPMVCFGADDFTTVGDASTVVGTFTTNIGSILHSSLPTILVVVASLLGIAILIRWTKRFVK